MHSKRHIRNILNNMIIFEKYKQNLRVVGNYVISYTTKVAEIKGNELHQLGWWSVTTQKHINYAAKELQLELIKNKQTTKNE